MKRLARGLVVGIALSLVAACGDSGGGASQLSASLTATSATTGSITVLAAASLTDAFDQIGDAFMKAHPGTKVTFGFDASSALEQQIAQGAPADVYASADTANMDKLVKAGLNAAAPANFAGNLLAIIVGAGNPKRITGVADLTKPGLRVAVCADGVPCGNYAKQIFAKANVTVKPVTMEQNVKGVVTKVTTGEADAGIVYATDVRAAGSAAGLVSIPADQNVLAHYPIVAVKASKNAGLDAEFIAFVLSADGQAILASFGFGAP